MTSPIDYQAVLADLEAKRGQLDAAIAVIRALISGGVTPEDSASGVDVSSASPAPQRSQRQQAATSGVIQNDTFFGLSTPDAIRKFLSMTKRPQKVSDIGKALLEGGQIHARDVTTAYNNAYASLKRMRNAGVAVRIKTGEWGLAEWYGSNKPKPDDT